jgi:hypothetical protein
MGEQILKPSREVALQNTPKLASSVPTQLMPQILSLTYLLCPLYKGLYPLSQWLFPCGPVPIQL